MLPRTLGLSATLSNGSLTAWTGGGTLFQHRFKHSVNATEAETPEISTCVYDAEQSQVKL